MTDYYVDSAATGAADGTTMADAWTTLDSAKAALGHGDNLWIRRTHAESISAQISITGGTDNSQGYCWIGWPISGDPLYDSRPSDTASWDSDSTASLPTITTTVTTVTGSFIVNSLAFCGFHRLKMVSGAAAVDCGIYFNMPAITRNYELTVDLSASTDTNGACLNPANNSVVCLKGGALVGPTSVNNWSNIEMLQVTTLYMDGVSIDGGGRGVKCSGGFAYLKDCVFGAVTAPSVSDILELSGYARLTGCTMSTASVTYEITGFQGRISAVHADATLNDYISKSIYLTTEKTTGVVRSGGGDFSLVMTPIATNVETNHGNIVAQFGGYKHGLPNTQHSVFPDDAWSVYCTAAATTISVYVYTREWTTKPTASQLFLLANYISNGTTGETTDVYSTEAVAANDTWTELSVTFTPAAAGLVHLILPLTIYESGSPTRDVLVDPLPVIS